MKNNIWDKDIIYLKSAVSFSKTPNLPLAPHIAFIGRSNVGKSSLINALFNHNIAKTSKTPGRTQMVNFFLWGSKYLVVDLPGYGYAKSGDNFLPMMKDYMSFASKHNVMFNLLIDSRRGFMEKDIPIIELLLPYKHWQIVLTKADKLSEKKQDDVYQQIMNNIKLWDLKDINIVSTSSSKNKLSDIKKSIYSFLQQ